LFNKHLIFFFFIFVCKKSRCPMYIIAQKKSRSHVLLSKKKCLSHHLLYRSHPGDKYCLVPYVETSPSPVKGCKISAYARRSGPLSREGSLSCHTCCDTGPRFFRSHPKDRPFSRLLRHTRGCGGFLYHYKTRSRKL
jgi:hypothetical protein